MASADAASFVAAENGNRNVALITGITGQVSQAALETSVRLNVRFLQLPDTWLSSYSKIRYCETLACSDCVHVLCCHIYKVCRLLHSTIETGDIK